MNADTLALLRRPYQQIVDDVLTAVVGGVVNEPIVFDVKQDVYPVSATPSAIRSVNGQRTLPGQIEPVAYTFQPGIDYELDEGHRAVAWLAGGARPDDDSTFYVSYFQQGASPPITDINVGSVTRIISEAVGREITTVYQEILQVYLSAFLDTAEGASLDHVVSILGLIRKRASSAQGLVTFFRAAGAAGTITIPQGLEVRTAKATAVFEVSEERTMQQGQARIDVPVRAKQGFEGDKGKVGAGEITEVSQIIAGIDHITNVGPTVLGAADESDADLRLRARAALRGLGKATLAALAHAVFDEGGTLIEAWDPNSVMKPSDVGQVALLVQREPQGFPGLQARVNQDRAAGVLVTVVARYVFFKPRMVVAVTPGLTAAGRTKVVDEIIAAAQTYSGSVGAGRPAKGDALLTALKGVKDVMDLRLVDVMAWRSDVVRPGAETLVETLLAAVKDAAGNPDAQRAAFARILTEEAPAAPTGTRIPDRDLVQGPSGARATDAEIEAGQFSVVTPDATWWVYLDLEPTDVVTS